MLERAHRQRLTPETRQRDRIAASAVVEEHLERDATAERRVFRFVDDAHPALSEDTKDAVVAVGLGQGIHEWCCAG